MDSSLGHTDYESVEPEVLLTSKLKNPKGFLWGSLLGFPEAELAPNLGRALRLTGWGRVRELKGSP